jgi:6-phosphogluconolactonase
MGNKLRIMYQVEPDGVALAALAAVHLVELVEEAVVARGRARIAVSGGSTPKAVFALLADYRRPWFARMPWEKLELFWVDERCVPPDHAESNYRMTREALLDHVPLNPQQIHRMEGELEPEVAAARYESELRNSRVAALRRGGAWHGRRWAHGLDLSAHRGDLRDDAAGGCQPGSTKGCVAHYTYLAGD